MIAQGLATTVRASARPCASLATRSRALAVRNKTTATASPAASDGPRTDSAKARERKTGLMAKSKSEVAAAAGIPKELLDMPANVLSTYLAPLKRPKTHGHRVAQIQLRSYEAKAVEFYADFCMRVGYYLHVPMSGVALLPRKRELWTLNRSPFVHKRSQENFERITYSRLITCYDANSDVVQMLLGYLRENGYPGVGIKANLFGQEGLDARERLLAATEGVIERPELYRGHRSNAIASTAKSILESPEYADLMKDAPALQIPHSTEP